MSLEKVYRSKEGYSEIDKITRYMASLIVKNSTEAAKYENKTTMENYAKYASAYTNSMNPYDYKWTFSEVNAFFNKNVIENYVLTTPEGVSKLLNHKDYKNDAEKFMKYLQNREISKYGETNEYYKTFMGLPPDIHSVVEVENLDYGKNEINMSKFIPIHSVRMDLNPDTYEFYFIKDNIRVLYDRYPDLDYLKFINNKYTPYYLRTCPDFTILYSDKSILNQEEHNRFNTAYSRAQSYVNEILFIVGMNDRFPLYSNLMYLYILFYTFQIYYNLRLKDYSLTKYTNSDIYDILESNGLGSLRKISDMTLLKKVVKNLDRLKEYKGSEKALSLLFDLINDNTLTVKRYDLIKKYPVDLTNSLSFDTNMTYDEQVDLKFKENVIRTNELYYTPREIDYDAHVESDELWGSGKDISIEIREKAKKMLKNKLLSMDFSSISTKYIGLSKSLNMYEVSIESANILYLILKYCYDDAGYGGYNPLIDDKILFDPVENLGVQPTVLFAGICYFHSIVNGLSNPDEILSDRTIIGNVNILRGKHGLKGVINELNETEIDIYNPTMRKTVGELLSGENLEEFLISYGIDTGSTLISLIDDYGDNVEIMSKLNEIISNTDNMELYDAWYHVYQKNKIDYNFKYIFEDYSTYTGFISDKNPWFGNEIDKILSQIEDFDDKKAILEVLGKKCVQWVEIFQKYLQQMINEKYTIALTESERDAKYLSDLKILLDNFLSIYSELYKMEYITDISDVPYNNLKLWYLELEAITREENTEFLHFDYHLNYNLSIEDFDSEIEFKHKMIEILLDEFKQDLELVYEANYDKLIEEFDFNINPKFKILKDISIEEYEDDITLLHFLEEMSEILWAELEDKLEFEYSDEKDEIFELYDDTIAMGYILKGDIYYEEYSDYIEFKYKKGKVI